MIRVPRRALIVAAPGLNARVLLAAEDRTEAIPMRMLLTRLVKVFYRPIDVIMPTGAARLPGVLGVAGRLGLEEVLK